MKDEHEIHTDAQGRQIIGSGPDRTCLDCGIGFSFDKMNKDESSPCCNGYRYAGVLWEDGPLQEWKKDGANPSEEFDPKKGLFKKLDSEYDPNRAKPSLEEFRTELYKFFSDNPEKEKEFERNEQYMQKISPYLDMTEEQMKACIPDGAYELSGGGMVVWTGKGGFIMSIMAMQKELKKYK